MTRTEQVLNLARERGVLRPRDLEKRSIPRVYLQVLYDRGELLRPGRGLYTLPADQWTEHHTLAEVCARIPDGVICLLSALRFHDLTTQDPTRVWVAISPWKHRPRIDHPAVRIVRFSGKALAEGVESHTVEGVSAQIYNPAKTVADCFKYRNKIGLDVALKALRDTWKKRRCTMDELWRYAGICRVANVMRPYLESLL
ncbi:MAG: type IV toxin-antitoxin system AbiEi family antitoxin domain-containing protein [bacterium]|nr:type IV toxin-antitoxin system AbiEi family antitoxin domain-containing protein [bacterium]